MTERSTFMLNQFSRTQLLLGPEAMEHLAECRVAVFGIGGVGGYVVEALARSGIGSFVLVDHDRIAFTNLNRQIIALESTLGQYKVDAAAARIRDINPEASVEVHRCFFLPDTAGDFDFSAFDYVVDAVDTVTAKLLIIEKAKEARVPVISAMGAGNKLDPTKFEVTDLYRTRMDPLAKVMRRELKKRGITELKVVYSTEQPVKPPDSGALPEVSASGRPVPGSVAFVPSVAGLIIAGEVVKDLSGTVRP